MNGIQGEAARAIVPAPLPVRAKPRISTIVLAYAAVSLIYIATSDAIVEAVFSSRAAATQISIGKGFAFVLLTSWLIYVLLRRYQQQLERAHEDQLGQLVLLQAVSDNSSDAIYAKDVAGRYTLCNEAVAAILDRPRDEIIGKTDAELFPNTEAQAVAVSDRSVLAQKKRVTLTEVIPTPRGPRIFDTIKGPLVDAGGNLIGVFGVSRDATERLAAAEGARNAAVELAATLQAIPDLLFDLDENGVYREVWARNPELLMTQRDLVLGKNIRDVLPAAAAAGVADAIAAAKVAGSSYGQVIALPLPQGTQWFELSTAKKGVDKDGVAHFLMLSRDVTARKLAEAELLQHQEYLRLMLANAPAALAMFDKLMRYVTVSDRWLSDYKVKREDVIGRSHYDVFPNLPEAWKEIHRRGLAGEIIRREEDHMILPDGTEAWLRWEVHPWRSGDSDADGGVGGIVIFTEDISARKAAEASIAAYVEKIERTARGSLQVVANAVAKRDPYTSGHEQRVDHIAVDIARRMGWSQEQCRNLEMLGMVHDIGKIGIPSEILTKPSRLSPAEAQLMRAHPQIGYEILEGIDFPTPVAEVILQHHEHLDGSGYPRGLKGDEILPETRIVTVADVLESMASHRPYRPARGIDEALEELEGHSGTWYDPDVVATVVRMIREEGYKLPTP